MISLTTISHLIYGKGYAGTSCFLNGELLSSKYTTVEKRGTSLREVVVCKEGKKIVTFAYPHMKDARQAAEEYVEYLLKNEKKYAQLMREKNLGFSIKEYGLKGARKVKVVDGTGMIIADLPRSILGMREKTQRLGS